MNFRGPKITIEIICRDGRVAFTLTLINVPAGPAYFPGSPPHYLPASKHVPDSTSKIIIQTDMAPIFRLPYSFHNLPVKLMVRREEIFALHGPCPRLRLEADDPVSMKIKAKPGCNATYTRPKRLSS
jgi:hypothetical protein